MLSIDILCESSLNANTYVVGNELECIIIDPANDVRNIKKLINKRKVVGIFLTHGHFDHFKTLTNLMKEYDTTIYLHKNALIKLRDPNISCSNMFGYNMIIELEPNKYHLVHDGEKLQLLNKEIKIITTPGHTNCSVCYIIDELMFSGDTLFEEGVGRSDLPTGSTMELVKSIKMLLNLKTDYTVYPGHGDATSIYHEIKNNLFFQNIK